MIGLLIVTHCELGKELLNAAEFVVGKIEAVDTIAITETSGTDLLRKKIEAKIGALAVGTAAIKDGAITRVKIGDAQIVNAKIADATIQSAKIASLAADKITAGTISASISMTAPTITVTHVLGLLLRVKACPQHAIDVRGYADFAPLGHSVRVHRDEEKGTIAWKIKFRNGTEKSFLSPITTKPWGTAIPTLAEVPGPSREMRDSELLYSEPKYIRMDDGGLHTLKAAGLKMKKGVYY